MVKDEKPEETEEVEEVEEVTPAETETTEEPEVQTEEPSSEEATETTEEETPEETEEAKFEKRFPRFKGETPEEYIKNLEDGYDNSSTEAVRLARENKELRESNLTAIANEEETTETTPTPPPNPTLAWAEQQREKEWKQDWADFAKLHPVIEEDQTLFADFDKKTGEMFNFIQQTEQRFPTLGEAMQKAWNYMNPDEISKEEEIAIKAKENGAGTKTKGVSKDQPKPAFSQKQLDTARKFDPTLRDKSDAEVEKELSKYVKA